VLESEGRRLTGRVEGAGAIVTGAQFHVLPQLGEKPVTVKIKNLPKPAFSGDFLTLEIEDSKDALTLLEPLFAASAVVLVPAGPTQIVSRLKITAAVKVFTQLTKLAAGEELLIPGRQLVMHCGPAAVVVMVTRIVEARVTKKRLAGGEEGLVEIESLSLPVAVYPGVSRIVLRHRGVTVAAGTVS